MVKNILKVGIAIVLISPLSISYAKQNIAQSFVSCVLRPMAESNVSSHIPGVIDKIHLKEGSYVKKGTRIASIDTSEERIKLLSSKERAGIIRAKLNRYRYMLAQRDPSVSEAGIDAIQMELKLAYMEHRDIKKIIRMKTINSPIAGFITKQYIAVGEYAGSEPVARVVNLSSLKADIVLNDGAFGNVKIGQSIKIKVHAPIDSFRVAKITAIDKVVDPASNTFGVEAIFSNNKEPIPSGIGCSAHAH